MEIEGDGFEMEEMKRVVVDEAESSSVNYALNQEEDCVAMISTADDIYLLDNS